MTFTGWVPSVPVPTVGTPAASTPPAIRLSASWEYPSGSPTLLYRRQTEKLSTKPLPRVVHMDGSTPTVERKGVPKKTARKAAPASPAGSAGRPGPGAALLPGQGQQHQQKNCQHQAGEHLGPVEIIAVVGVHVGRGAQVSRSPGKMVRPRKLMT